MAQELIPSLGVMRACDALNVNRAGFYRLYRPTASEGGAVVNPAGGTAAAGWALKIEEKRAALQLLQSERFVDQSPPQVWATLLDENIYLCSVSTMYRLLRENDQVRERRRQRRHGQYKVPRLVATASNQVWSWDITKLKGPAKWCYYYLYVILDIFSRYVVGWMVAEQESQALASELIEQSCLRQNIVSSQLTLHSDRGAPMTSHSVAELLSKLGITKSHSRPRVSNDNPFSEAQFKTLKYAPDFPLRFGSPEHARDHGRTFFGYYNNEHHHSALALLTPHMVHYRLTEQILAARQATLNQAYLANPERFRRPPQVQKPPQEVWINCPSKAVALAAETE